LINAIGFNVSHDPWFYDKMFVVAGIVLFYPDLVYKIEQVYHAKIRVIDLHEARTDITVNVFIPASEQTKWRAPMLLLVFESISLGNISNEYFWGQLKIIQAEPYITQVPATIDIPAYWYKTIGCIALYSVSTGRLYVWNGTPLDDMVYVTIPGIQTISGASTEGRIVIVRPTGEKIVMPSIKLYEITPQPITALFMDVSLSTATGILSIALIAAVMVWCYRNEQDPFTGGAYAAAIVTAIGLLLAIFTGNYTVVGVGLTALAALIAYRIVRRRPFYG